MCENPRFNWAKFEFSRFFPILFENQNNQGKSRIHTTHSQMIPLVAGVENMLWCEELVDSAKSDGVVVFCNFSLEKSQKNPNHVFNQSNRGLSPLRFSYYSPHHLADYADSRQLHRTSAPSDWDPISDQRPELHAPDSY